MLARLASSGTPIQAGLLQRGKRAIAGHVQLVSQPFAMIAMKVNAIIAPPVGADALAAYFKDANEALAFRSDADMARELSVSASTLASWKRRGFVQEPQRRWLVETLPMAVLSRWREKRAPAFPMAVASAVRLIRRGGVGDDAVSEEVHDLIFADLFPGLVSLGAFVMKRAGWLTGKDEDAIQLTSDALAAVLVARGEHIGRLIPWVSNWAPNRGNDLIPAR